MFLNVAKVIEINGLVFKIFKVFKNEPSKACGKQPLKS